MNKQLKQFPLKNINGNSKAKLKKVTVRLDKFEFKSIFEKANQANLRISSYMREVAKKSVLKPGLLEEDRKYIRQIISSSNDLHTLFKSLNTQNCGDILKTLSNFQETIDKLLQKIYNDK